MSSSKSEQYIIVRAVLTADRFETDGIDISNIIHELNLYEHLEKPYISGQLMLVDMESILDDINFRGTETFHLELGLPGKTPETIVTRRFAVTGIEKSVKTNERAEVFVVNLLDESAFLSFSHRFSKSYTGKGEEIITTIMSSELGQGVDLSYGSISAQEKFKVVIPYLTPLQACEWLRQGITTVNGSPWFFYASIHDDKLRLGDLDTIIGLGSTNDTAPFIYSVAAMHGFQTKNDYDQHRVVLDLNKSMMEETLEVIKQGGISSKVSSTNLLDGKTISHDYKVIDTLEKLRVNQVLSIGYEQNVYDINHKINHSVKGRLGPDAYQSRYFHTISNSKVYPDVDNFSLDHDAADLNNRVSNLSIKSLFYKNMLDVQVMGSQLMAARVSVGDTVTINFLGTNVHNNRGSVEDLIDKNRSGDYIIYTMKHIFKEGTHHVLMTVGKLSKRKTLI